VHRSPLDVDEDHAGQGTAASTDGRPGTLDRVPEPRPSPIRLLSVLLPGIRRVTEQVEPYAAAWAEATEAALFRSGAPLLAVLGDSTGQGVGADDHTRGWAGQLAELLGERDGTPWVVANWSRSGAKVADVVASQLPALEAAPRRPDLVACAVGSNDVFWGLRTAPARRALDELLPRLPRPAVVATVPEGLLAARSRMLNRHLLGLADDHGVAVADVNRTIRSAPGTLASDGFHPTALGYADWTAAFAAALDLPDPRAGAR
jgi:lysophospholipase L1-like esterase